MRSNAIRLMDLLRRAGLSRVDARHSGAPHTAVLHYLRSAGVPYDERMAEALELVASKRDGNGLWPLETRYPGVMPVEIDQGVRHPSRWNTLNWFQQDHGRFTTE